MFVCFFVIYAFEHDTTKCNDILQGIPFRPEKGRRIVFNSKFPHQGGSASSYCWIYYSKCLSREFVRMIVLVWFGNPVTRGGGECRGVKGDDRVADHVTKHVIRKTWILRVFCGFIWN